MNDNELLRRLKGMTDDQKNNIIELLAEITSDKPINDNRIYENVFRTDKPMTDEDVAKVQDLIIELGYCDKGVVFQTDAQF